MRPRETVRIIALLALLFPAAACQVAQPQAAPSASAAAVAPAELKQQPYLFEIVRYLYRWQMDEVCIDARRWQYRNCARDDGRGEERINVDH